MRFGAQRITKNGVPMTESSVQSAVTSGTGTSLPASAFITRYSRSIACADGKSLPGGFLRTTKDSSPIPTQYVGFD